MKREIAILATVGAMLVGCSPSGYHLMARNNCAQPVELRMVAKKKDDSVRTLEAPQVAPGANIRVHTMADHDEKVTLEARISGDSVSPPSVLKLFVGESRVVVGPNPEAGKDEKQPKVLVRPDR